MPQDPIQTFRTTPEATQATNQLSEQLEANKSETIRLAILYSLTHSNRFIRWCQQQHRKTW
jgi:hypothetical protein